MTSGRDDAAVTSGRDDAAVTPPNDDQFVVEQVRVEVTWALRQRVLRPHQQIADMALPGDDDARAGHFAAYDWAGAVVGTATVRPDAVPPELQQAGPASASQLGRIVGWRLRGMATDERWRGRGVGAGVLARVLEHVGRAGGGLLWCHARTPALTFYLRAGLVAAGEPWDDARKGPHVLMWRRVPGWTA